MSEGFDRFSVRLDPIRARVPLSPAEFRWGPTFGDTAKNEPRCSHSAICLYRSPYYRPKQLWTPIWCIMATFGANRHIERHC